MPRHRMGKEVAERRPVAAGEQRPDAGPEPCPPELAEPERPGPTGELRVTAVPPDDPGEEADPLSTRSHEQDMRALPASAVA